MFLSKDKKATINKLVILSIIFVQSIVGIVIAFSIFFSNFSNSPLFYPLREQVIWWIILIVSIIIPFVIISLFLVANISLLVMILKQRSSGIALKIWKFATFRFNKEVDEFEISNVSIKSNENFNKYAENSKFATFFAVILALMFIIGLYSFIKRIVGGVHTSSAQSIGLFIYNIIFGIFYLGVYAIFGFLNILISLTRKKIKKMDSTNKLHELYLKVTFRSNNKYDFI